MTNNHTSDRFDISDLLLGVDETPISTDDIMQMILDFSQLSGTDTRSHQDNETQEQS